MSPLSFGQETMLFWDNLVPNIAVYSVPIVFTTQSTMQRMLDEYASLLRRVVKDLDARLRDLSVGTPNL